MVTKEDILKQKEHKLNISRLPKDVKDEFMKLANEQFCGDYGMTLKYVWDTFKMWKLFYENLDYKLDAANDKLDDLSQNNTQEEPSDTEGKKMMGGNTISTNKSKRKE